MSVEYSVEACKTLSRKFAENGLHRPMRVERYDAGDELTYEMTAVVGARDRRPVTVCLRIEKFVGGGFAGQVYRVQVTHVEEGGLPGIEPGGFYAMKILVPPSHFSMLFRNLIYGIGFQGPFQPGVNPAAARSGALWQKFIHRGARIRFGTDGSVNDVHATFVDTALGSCGELSDWVDGRTWLLEVDEHLDYLSRWRKGKPVNEQRVGSPEYRAKRTFMREFVQLLHDMGAHEFARQYEWWTCKSQPNCLKRTETDTDPAAGLTAVDFRAGLALLPFLPMSPGDVRLIFDGIRRGGLVQFDRGDLGKLTSFVGEHRDRFRDLEGMLDELRALEVAYRNSVPDFTHNHIRLLYSRTLWSTMIAGAVTGWRVRNIVDRDTEERLRRSAFLVVVFAAIGLIPVLGGFLRRIWGRSDFRRHYGAMLYSPIYLWRTIRGNVAEVVISWHRADRLHADRALKVGGSPGRFLCHLPFSILPVGLHKFFTDWKYLKNRLYHIIVRPVRLYFDAQLREQWLRDMVEEGKKKYLINEREGEEIVSRIKEPFVQKYLKSLAVHVCTVPVTQIVSVLVSWIYVSTHPGLSPAEAAAAVGAILVLFQITPISPGSLVRGFYVAGLVIRERNFRDYNIAVFLGFFKYIGYLAFPIQMAYRYPTLARFMAGYWATEAVHVVPVFGEPGALLEHWVFRLFYNWPLTIRRRVSSRLAQRAREKPGYRHIAMLVTVGTGLFAGMEYLYLVTAAHMPTLGELWWFVAVISPALGAGVTLGCGGATMWRRIAATVAAGVLTGMLWTAVSVINGAADCAGLSIADTLVAGAWRVFALAVLATLGTGVTELLLPDPDVSRAG